MFGITHPIALAPMGGSAGGALAAAVSSGGGLGLLGSGNGDREWLARELPLVAEGTGRPWGVGFQSWAIDPDAVEYALRYEPAAVMLSFGDPRPFAELVRRSEATLIIQVTDRAEARQAVVEGADLIIAQGTEAGGHGARRGWSTLAFVPAVVDLAAPTPVLAAGGIADGRGVAAALALGAAGALVGTRFLATAEALTDPEAKKAIVDGDGEETERSSVLDIARSSRWPLEYTGRTLGHPFLDRWRDAEAELAADPDDVRRAYRESIARGEIPAEPVWASQAIGLISDLPPAAELVGVLAAQAEQALRRASRHTGPVGPRWRLSRRRHQRLHYEIQAGAAS
jgi:nitronate monooxygenase